VLPLDNRGYYIDPDSLDMLIGWFEDVRGAW